MTTLTKAVTRKVGTRFHGDLVVKLAPEGIYLRQPRCRTSYLIPYGVAFQRAVAIEVARKQAEKKAAAKERRRRRD